MKKRVCLILPRKLFPLVSGYSLKNYYLIQILSRQYNVNVVLISNGKLENEELEFYQKYTESYKVYPISKAERIQGVIFALFRGLPIQVGLYQSCRLFKWLKKEENGHTDILISELVRTMPYVEAFGDHVEKVFDMVDSIGLNYSRSMDRASSFIWKLYYRIESKRLLRYEEHCVKKADVTFLFNQEEREYWKRYGNVQWLPHGVKEELLTYEGLAVDEENPFVAFIGKMNYRPNVDAVVWYAENIHCKLKQKIRFVIVGAYPTAEVLKLQEKYENITVTGFVENPYEILSQAIAMVAPMQTGGGIQNKVLEAMAIGKVNLLSEKAAKPITGAKDGVHFLCSDSLDDYETYLQLLLDDPEKRQEIGRCAQAFIRNNYTWEKYGKQYIDFLER